MASKTSEATWISQYYLEDEFACCGACCCRSCLIFTFNVLQWMMDLLLCFNVATLLLFWQYYRTQFRKFPLVRTQYLVETMTVACIVSLI